MGGVGKKFLLGKTFKGFDLCIVAIFKSDYVSSLEDILVPEKVHLGQCNIMTDLLSVRRPMGKVTTVKEQVE